MEIDKTFKSVLKRHGFEVAIKSNEIAISKVNKGSSPVGLYLRFAIIMSIIGILSFLIVSILFGVIILSSSIPLYLKVSKLKNRERGEKNKSIIINGDAFSIISGDKETVFKREALNEIKFHTEKDKDISTGKISVVVKLADEKAKEYDLLEIFGDNKRYVEDDTKIIVNHIARILNESL